MKLHPECIACVVTRALHDADLARATPEQKMEIMRKFLPMILNAIEIGMTPAELGSHGEFLIQKITGNEDPYQELKRKSTEIAQRVLSQMKINLEPTYDNFKKLCHLAAAANAIEFGIHGYISTEEILTTLEKVLKAEIAIDESENLWKTLQKAKTVLYLLDNAGEHVFDKVFCEFICKLGKNVIIGARKKPVLNDVTVDNAIEIGFNEIGEVIPVSEFIGVIFEKTTEEFRAAWKKADLVIAKGMGNFETLTEYSHSKPVFVLLKAKCIPVARELGVMQGSLIIKQLV